MDTTKKDLETPILASGAISPSPSKVATEDDIQPGTAGYVPDYTGEKLLVRKADMYMVPTLWLMCVLAYVDRNNIGNVKAAGMSDDLGLTDSNYLMLISIFFIGYLLFEIPSNMILVAAMSQVKSYHGIFVCRFFLGIIESGFMPGVMYLMSCGYKRDEIGKRFSIFFTALCIAGAVSTLLSGAIIIGLEDAHDMEGCRWLFLLEGVITVGVAACCKLILLDYPATSRRLSPEECQLAAGRIIHGKQATSSQATGKLSPVQVVIAALVDLRTYFFMALYLLNNGCATIDYFVPTLLSDMDYAGIMAQWMTVPIRIVGTVLLVLTSLSSDPGRRGFNWGVAGRTYSLSMLIEDGT